MKPVKHLPYLDGLRGLAILGVMVNHMVPMPGALYCGWMGVELFFVLSGFLITRILLDEREGGGGQAALGSFYARRALRIFPVYFLALAALVAISAPGIWKHLVYHLTYTYNFRVAIRPAEPSVVLHFWSLCVEEQFYLVWPWLMLFLPGRWLLPAMVATVFVAPLTRTLFALQHRDRLWLYMMTPCSLDCLSLGGILALVERRVGTANLSRSAFVRTCGWLGGALMVLFIYLAIRPTPLTFSRRSEPNLDVIWIVGNSILALFFTYVVALACNVGDGDLQRLLGMSWLRFLGKISYGLYVYHGMIAFSIRRIPPESLAIVQPLFWFGVPLSFLLATVSWYAFERPLLALKDRFTTERVRKWLMKPIEANEPTEQIEPREARRAA